MKAEKSMQYKKYYLFMGLVFFSVFFSRQTLAFEKEMMPATQVKNDFVLSGGKIEAEMDPGEKITKEITITSRLGRTMVFHVGVEDIRGSKNPDDPTVVFLGEEKGPFSLKNYVKPEVSEFSLDQAERIRMKFEISVPENAEPGGLYGSVVVWATDPEKEQGLEKDKAKSQLNIVSRLASLLFVRVKGVAKEEGELKNFQLEKKFYEKGPVIFKLNYENKGSVHLNPYGIIEIKNFLGRVVGDIEIRPFYTLPDSVRWQEFDWKRKPLIGVYTAKLSLNRGYDDIVDYRTIRFWVIPWKMLALIFTGFILLFWLIVRVSKRYEIRRKKIIR